MKLKPCSKGTSSQLGVQILIVRFQICNFNIEGISSSSLGLESQYAVKNSVLTVLYPLWRLSRSCRVVVEGNGLNFENLCLVVCDFVLSEALIF
jgi:hypothetical protein